MKFDKFNSRAGSGVARPLHLRHPATGKPLFDNEADPTEDNGKPCRVMVLGVEDVDTMAQIRAIRGDSEKTKNQVEYLVSVTAPLIAGFENIEREDGKGARPLTTDDAMWVLRLQAPNGSPGQRSFLEQVAGFAADRANYLGN